VLGLHIDVNDPTFHPERLHVAAGIDGVNPLIDDVVDRTATESPHAAALAGVADAKDLLAARGSRAASGSAWHRPVFFSIWMSARSRR